MMKFPRVDRFIWSMLVVLCRWATRKPCLVPGVVQGVRETQCWGKREAGLAPCPANENGQCQDCTCLIPLKVMFAHEECPRKKWGRWGIYKIGRKRTKSKNE